VFENRVLRRIFGPKRDEVRREWRRLHNEKLNDLFSSPNIVRVIKIEKNEIGGACSTYGEKRGACWILVRRPERKRPLGRPRHRWKDNIKRDLREVGWEGMDWIGLAEDRDRWRAPVNAVRNLRVP
jgi:hypothetical protein